MKIYIIGASGSGKSYLGNKISKAFDVPYFALDEFFWEDNGTYSKTRDQVERSRLLNHALESEQWVIEGVYYEWVQSCFEQADAIILLKVPLDELKIRIWGRYHKRQRSNHQRKETKETVQELIDWVENQFIPINLKRIERILEQFPDKVIIATNADQSYHKLLAMPFMIQERKEE